MNSASDKTVLLKLTVMLQWKTGRRLASELLSVEQNALTVFLFYGFNIANSIRMQYASRALFSEGCCCAQWDCSSERLWTGEVTTLLTPSVWATKESCSIAELYPGGWMLEFSAMTRDWLGNIYYLPKFFTVMWR